jgi:hypothetical protein
MEAINIFIWIHAHDDPVRIKMAGNQLFKVAVRALAEVSQEALKYNGFTSEDIDLMIPHQANTRIIEAAAKLINFPMDKVFLNIEKYGNTSSATIPIAHTFISMTVFIASLRSILFHDAAVALRLNLMAERSLYSIKKGGRKAPFLFMKTYFGIMQIYRFSKNGKRIEEAIRSQEKISQGPRSQV